MDAIIKKKPSLGIGLYTIPDVANILNLNRTLVRRWLREYWGQQFRNKGKSYASWGKGRGKAIHFYTLIEFYVFYQLRKQGVSAQHIAKSHETISQELNISFPFANATILTDGKKVFYTKDGDDHALRYWPLGKAKNIVVEPYHQLGQPTVKNTNILAETLYSMYTSGEKVNFISSLYDVSEADVKASIEFFKKAA